MRGLVDQSNSILFLLSFRLPSRAEQQRILYIKTHFCPLGPLCRLNDRKDLKDKKSESQFCEAYSLRSVMLLLSATVAAPAPFPAPVLRAATRARPTDCSLTLFLIFNGRPRGHAPTVLLTDTVSVLDFFSICISFTQRLIPL